MSNTRPYLFGAVLGASAMYVALQYHVVHSHDGFQMVPRTPQHSVGLAYADVRNWSPSQWTDRPELARALMAHGSSDLISKSVAHSLADIVTEENSTLDQLRTFLDKSALDGVEGDAAGQLEIPTSIRKPADTNSGADDVLTGIPFPQDARKVVADPFRVARSPENGAAAVTGPSLPPVSSRFSAADVIEGLRSNDVSNPASPISPSFPQSIVPKTGSDMPASVKPTAASVQRTPAQQGQATEARIFDSLNSTHPASDPSASSDDDSMFEEVSTQLENRAQAALNRAKEAATDKAGSAASGSTKSSESYVRKNVPEPAPGAVKPVIKDTASENPSKPAGISLDQFDPFLE